MTTQREEYRSKVGRLKARYVSLANAMRRRQRYWNGKVPEYRPTPCANAKCNGDVCRFSRAMARVSRVAGQL